MPRTTLCLIAFLLALATSASAETEADVWTPGDAAEGDGFSYQIFSKNEDGHVVYQARGKVRAEPAVLVRSVRAVASDPARAPDGQTRRIVSSDEDGFTVHTYIDLPTLFSDRDIVTHGSASVDAETGHHRVDWKAIEHREVPVVEGTIRIDRSAGFWDFVSAGGGETTAVYETYVDLGGSFPGWLVGSMMGGMVGSTFEEVAKEALGK